MKPIIMTLVHNPSWCSGIQKVHRSVVSRRDSSRRGVFVIVSSVSSLVVLQHGLFEFVWLSVCVLVV